jgi:hypothetical protein
MMAVPIAAKQRLPSIFLRGDILNSPGVVKLGGKNFLGGMDGTSMGNLEID